MFYIVILIILAVSFILSLMSLKTINENPKVSDVRKSRDKGNIIVQGHSSSEEES